MLRTVRLKHALLFFPCFALFPHTWSHAFWWLLSRRYFVLAPLKLLMIADIERNWTTNKAASFGLGVCPFEYNVLIRAPSSLKNDYG
jgi:hypothetical protein